MSTTTASIREEVRRKYAEAALAATRGSPAECCDSSCCADLTQGLDSAEEPMQIPEGAVLASLGSGNPTAVAGLHSGDTVLDLGAGGGVDVILASRLVGPAGIVYGLDMTDEMLALGRQNVRAAGLTNVHFLKGLIEEIPLPPASVDVVMSNCVINLSTDKAAVLAETARVLGPGGRLAVSDIVAEDRLTPAERAERGSYVGCIAGALSRSEYEEGLDAAGFRGIEVRFTGRVADGIHGAIVKAVKPY